MTESDEDSALKQCQDVQALIDIAFQALVGTRNCSTSSEITRQEIRSLESLMSRATRTKNPSSRTSPSHLLTIRRVEAKCIRHVAKILVTKKRVNNSSKLSSFPSLKQWFKIVGLSTGAQKAMCANVPSFEDQLKMTESTVKNILKNCQPHPEDHRKFITSIKNLKSYYDHLITGKALKKNDLHWDSWNQNGTEPSTSSNRITSPRTQKASPSSSSSRAYPPPPPPPSSSNAPSTATSGVPSTSSWSGSASQLANGSKMSPLSPPQSVSSRSCLTSPSPVSDDGLDSARCSPSPKLDHRLTGVTPPISRRGLPPGEGGPIVHGHAPLQLTHSQSTEDKLGVGSGGHSSSGVKDFSPMHRRRLATEPGLNTTSPVLSPCKSPPTTSGDQSDSCFDDPPSGSSSLPPHAPHGSCRICPEGRPCSCPTPPPIESSSMAPPSPRVHGAISHFIHHRFEPTLKFSSTCNFCQKSIKFSTAMRCTECGYLCHQKCQVMCPPSCGLKPGMLNYFINERIGSGPSSSEPMMSEAGTSSGDPMNVLSPSSVKSEHTRVRHKRVNGNGHHGYGHQTQGDKPTINVTPFGNADSSSNNSSCASSSPSSPGAMMVSSSHTPTPTSTTHGRAFHFPDVDQLHTLDPGGPNPWTISLDQGQSDLMVHAQGTSTTSGHFGVVSTDSERTLGPFDSFDGSSTLSADSEDRLWPRQNSLTSKEWEIPYGDIEILGPIGTGRFGIVLKGNWHGEVAVKRLNMTGGADDKKYIEAFKQEVATFRKTRHENLILFMGACMKSPNYAIVMSLCKGLTLYNHLHVKKIKFAPNKCMTIAQQICQGMSYLHSRDIIHKDLKSKNVFIDNGKVIITDFGLVSVTKLCKNNRKGDWLTIPKGWLPYLAPEIVLSLRPQEEANDEIPFSPATDVYAFGTVWYELLYGEWPFRGQPPEVMIWQVGKGMKPSLGNLQANKEAKDILMGCWDFHGGKRPPFSKLLDDLSKLPKKRLQRSPSHPAALTRAAESTF